MRRPRSLAVLAGMLLVLQVPMLFVWQQSASAATVTTFAGTGAAGYTGDGGLATAAQISAPAGIATDAYGNVYFDDHNNRVIRRVDPSGYISTVAGAPLGAPTSACSSTTTVDAQTVNTKDTQGIAVRSDGSIFMLYCGMTGLTSGTSISRYAGYYTTGSPCDCTGNATSVYVAPDNMAYDEADGALFYYDSGVGYIKEVTASGQVVNVVGSGKSCATDAYDGDAALSTCLVNYAAGLTFRNGSLYWASAYNTRSPIIFRYDVNGDGHIHAVAGTGSSCFCDSASGSSALATDIHYVNAIAVNASGEIFWANNMNGLVRMVDTSGIVRDVTTLAYPVWFMTTDPSGNLYAVEQSHHQIVKISGIDPAPTMNMVVLGDSVAAGEGINYGYYWNTSQTKWVPAGSVTPQWSDTTTAIGANFQDCHQSWGAYGRYFTSYNVFDMACTSATAMEGVLGQQTVGSSTVGAQLGGSCTGCNPANALFDSHNPDVVVLTVGADDVTFSDWVKTCYQPASAACNTSTNTAALNSQLATEQANLRTVLSELDSRAASAGKTLRVMVTGYYDPFPGTYTTCLDTSGGWLSGTYPTIGITQGEQAWLENGLATLNANISSEVTYAGANDAHLNVTYVDLSNAFLGHQFCDSDPWAYGASIAYPDATHPLGVDAPVPFHPTPNGQMRIHDLIAAQL